MVVPIAEQAKRLFGKQGAATVAAHLEQATRIRTHSFYGLLFPELEASPRPHKHWRSPAMANVSDDQLTPVHEATTLDRVHTAMLLQASRRTHILHRLLQAE